MDIDFLIYIIDNISLNTEWLLIRYKVSEQPNSAPADRSRTVDFGKTLLLVVEFIVNEWKRFWRRKAWRTRRNKLWGNYFREQETEKNWLKQAWESAMSHNYNDLKSNITHIMLVEYESWHTKIFQIA